MKATGCPNYQGARVNVLTELNRENWRHLCGNFRDQILIDYQFGFLLCADRNKIQHNTSTDNHSSAVKFPEDVQAYLNEELMHKAIADPYNNFQFPVHYSPLLSRPKPDDTRHTIVNLSYLYGRTVNDIISKDVYDTAQFNQNYRSFDHLLDAIDQADSRVL